MSEQRVDTISTYYKLPQKVDRISSFLMWMSICISIIVLFLNKVGPVKELINILYVIVTLLYFLASNTNDLYLLRKAENKRTTHLLTNGLGVALDDEFTNRYYNNELPPSIYRLGMNVFENTFFTSNISKKMFFYEFIKLIVYVIIWLALLLNRSTPLETIAVISQTLFGTTLITHVARIFILYRETNTLFEEFRNLFLGHFSKSSFDGNVKVLESQVLNLCVKYEVLKGALGILLSEKIFNEMNDKLTSEWEMIKRNIGAARSTVI